MQEENFAHWLAHHYRTVTGTVMDRCARASRLSNCRRLEQYLGDLDEAWDTDRMESLIACLELRRHETDPRHDIPFDGNLHDGTANLKSAARLYQKFRNATAVEESSNAEHAEAAGS
jgi:hypothetical protein